MNVLDATDWVFRRRGWLRWSVGAIGVGLLTTTVLLSQPRRCPPDMVEVKSFCIDRYETSSVDAASGQPLSPYYSPERRWFTFAYDAWETLRLRVGSNDARRMPLPELSEWQRNNDPKPKAVSQAGVVPQGYHSYYTARRACETAGKRLCTDEEWETACRGEQNTQFPYGDVYRSGPCNVSQKEHPAALLHGLSSSGHLDPRLNLLSVDGDAPVLRLTGASQECRSKWGADAIFDMVGNLDEWVADDEGAFRGGFYARRSQVGCDAQIRSHSATYFDYSTGVRCCRDSG